MRRQAFAAVRRSAPRCRGASAAAFPQDTLPPAALGRGSASLTPRQRGNFKLGASNPGAHLYNVYDQEAGALLDPVTGRAPDEKDSMHGMGPLGQEVTARGAPPAAPASLSSVQRSVLALKDNPPVDMRGGDANRYTMGQGMQHAAGSMDPLLRVFDAFQREYWNPHLVHMNETPEGIVECAMDGSRVEGGVLHQSFEDSKHECAVLQVPFSAKREEQGFKSMPLVKDAKNVDPVQPGRIEQELNHHFGTVGVGFICDGVAGSSADDHVKLRVYTDNSAHALFWTHLLHSLPGRDFWQMGMYRPPVTLFHAPGFTFENERVIEEYGGPKPKDLGLAHEKFVLVDPYSKPAMAVVSGELSLDVGRDVLAYLCGIVAFEELDVLTLPADAVMAADGTATVYFGAPESIRKSPDLYGAHHLTLSPDGLGIMWNAVTKPLDAATLQPTDLVTCVAGGKEMQTAPLLRRFGDASSRPKGRTQHWDTVNRRTKHVRYDSVDAARGMKFGAKASNTRMRPNIVPPEKVQVVFCEGGAKKELSADDAASRFVAAVKAWGYPYAKDEELAAAFQERGVKCFTGPPPS